MENPKPGKFQTALGVVLLLVIVLPFFHPVRQAGAELTQQDLDKISVLIDRKLEPIKLGIAEMKGKIETLEGKMATKDDLIALRDEMSEMKGRMDAMATKDDIITLQRTLTIALVTAWITIIAAIITIPYLYGRADRERVRQLEADVRELQKLKSEFETFKALTEAMESLREKARRAAQEKPELVEDLRTIGLL
jgi:outer membrane murein-binding lipoprotein Lpp